MLSHKDWMMCKPLMSPKNTTAFGQRFTFGFAGVTRLFC
jgi:hypothetical protein